MLVYNFKVNGMVERGYSPIIRALLILIDGGKGSWVNLLYIAFWVDRSTVK